MNQMKIGGFIKKLRKEKKLTQEQLSEVFGVSRRTVQDGKRAAICLTWISLSKWQIIFMLIFANYSMVKGRMTKWIKNWKKLY